MGRAPLILTSVLVLAGCANDDSAPAPAANTTIPANEKDEIPISAADLYAAFDDNEIAAEQRFKNHRVLISGEVRDIAKDVTGMPYVELAASEVGLASVQAMFSVDDAGLLVPLKKGQQVRVACRVVGKRVSVVLHECGFR